MSASSYARYEAAINAGRKSSPADDPEDGMAKRAQFCFYCGEPQGEFDAFGELVSCGRRECEREARELERTERDDAHRQLDADRGWDRL